MCVPAAYNIAACTTPLKQQLRLLLVRSWTSGRNAQGGKMPVHQNLRSYFQRFREPPPDARRQLVLCWFVQVPRRFFGSNIDIVRLATPSPAATRNKLVCPWSFQKLEERTRCVRSGRNFVISVSPGLGQRFRVRMTIPSETSLCSRTTQRAGVARERDEATASRTADSWGQGVDSSATRSKNSSDVAALRLMFPTNHAASRLAALQAAGEAQAVGEAGGRALRELCLYHV